MYVGFEYALALPTVADRRHVTKPRRGEGQGDAQKINIKSTQPISLGGHNLITTFCGG